MTIKLKLLSLALVLPFLASTCDNEQSDIKSVAYKYLDAMGNYRIADAKPYATKATKDNTIAFILESVMPYMDSSYITKNTPAKITIKGIRMVDDTHARVAFRKVTPIKTQNDSVTVVKVGSLWKVDQVMTAPGSDRPIMEKASPSDTSKVKHHKSIRDLDSHELEQLRKQIREEKNQAKPATR